jgi:hypothetical protein
MSWSNIFQCYNRRGRWMVPESLAQACEQITTIYPIDRRELKKAMVGHDLSLLIM